MLLGCHNAPYCIPISVPALTKVVMNYHDTQGWTLRVRVRVLARVVPILAPAVRQLSVPTDSPSHRGWSVTRAALDPPKKHSGEAEQRRCGQNGDQGLSSETS